MPQIDQSVLDGMLKTGSINKEAYDRLKQQFVLKQNQMNEQDQGPRVPVVETPKADVKEPKVEAPNVEAPKVTKSKAATHTKQDAVQEQESTQAQVQEQVQLPSDTKTLLATSQSAEVTDETIAAQKRLVSDVAKQQAKIEALHDMAAAAGAVGYAEGVAEAHARYVAKQAALMKEREELVLEYESRHSEVMNELRSKQVDPFRIFKNMQTKDKILLTLSTFLAGLGGGTNQVLSMINSAIDADIRAQIADNQRLLDIARAEESAYNKMMKVYDDKMAAALAVKSASLDIVQAKIDEVMLPLKNERQIAELQLLKQQIAKQQAELQAQLLAAMQQNPAVQKRLTLAEKVASIQDPKLREIALKEYETEKQYERVARHMNNEFSKVAEALSGANRALAGDDIERLKTNMIQAYEAVTGDNIKQNEKAVESVLGGFLPGRFSTKSKIEEKRQEFLNFLAEQRNIRTRTLIDLGITNEIKPISSFKKVTK